MPTASNRLTPEKIVAMRAAQARIAPFLPPDMARAIWIARLNGDYDPAGGKYAISALGLYPPGEQPRGAVGQTPGITGTQGGFGYGTVAMPRTQAPANPMPAHNPMPDTSGPLESPFVRAAFDSLAKSYARRGELSPFAPHSESENDDPARQEITQPMRPLAPSNPRSDMSGPQEGPFVRTVFDSLARSAASNRPAQYPPSEAPFAQMKYAEDDISNEIPGEPIWNAAPSASQAGNTQLAQSFINNNPISEDERQKKIDEYAEAARQFGKKTAGVGTLLMLGGGIVGGTTAQPEIDYGGHLLGGILENLGGLAQNPWLDRQYGRGRMSQFEYERSRAIDEYNRGMFFGTGGARAP